MPNWEHGIKCSEDTEGRLWVNNTNSGQSFRTYFPDIDHKAIQEILKRIRDLRRGAFWLDRERKKVIAAVGEQPNITYEEYPYSKM